LAYVALIHNLKDLKVEIILKDLKPKGSRDPRDLKTALFCISFLRKGEVLAYDGRIHNLKDLKGLSTEQVPVSAYGGSLKNLKDLKCPPILGARRT